MLYKCLFYYPSYKLLWVNMKEWRSIRLCSLPPQRQKDGLSLPVTLWKPKWSGEFSGLYGSSESICFIWYLAASTVGLDFPSILHWTVKSKQKPFSKDCTQMCCITYLNGPSHTPPFYILSNRVYLFFKMVIFENLACDYCQVPKCTAVTCTKQLFMNNGFFQKAVSLHIS